MFKFENLNSDTREYIVEAITEAEKSFNLYYGPHLKETAKGEFAALLKEAAAAHDEQWLTSQLHALDMMNKIEKHRTKAGKEVTQKMPPEAAENLAAGQFNRFYMLGLCIWAQYNDIPQLQVYRAKELPNPKPEAEYLVGKTIPVDDIEAQLKGRDQSLYSLLADPNSGLSLRLPG
jgi:hypothetical protein